MICCLSVLAGSTLDDRDALHAAQAADRGNHQEAVQFYTKALKRRPNDLDIFLNRGDNYIELKNYSAAINDFNRVLVEKPRCEPALRRRAFCHAMLKQYQQSVDDYSAVIKMMPKDPKTYHDRALAYEKMGQSALAQKDQEAMRNLAWYPGFDQQFAEARRLVNVGSLDKAIEAFDAIIASGGKQAMVYYWRGAAYDYKGDDKKAVNDVSRAVELDPKSASLRALKGVVYCHLEQYDRGIAECNAALAMHPSKNEQVNIISPSGKPFNQSVLHLALEARSAAYRGKGNFPKAIADITTLVQLEPRNAQNLVSRAYVYSRVHNYKQALGDCEAALRLESGNGEALINAARASFHLADYEKSIDFYTRYLRGNSNDDQGYAGRGEAYVCIGDWRHALDDYSKAIEKEPDFARYYNRRAEIYKHLGQAERAKFDLDKAAQVDNDNVKHH